MKEPIDNRPKIISFNMNYLVTLSMLLHLTATTVTTADESWDNYLAKVLEVFRSKMTQGIPVLGIPVLEPYAVPHFLIPHIS